MYSRGIFGSWREKMFLAATNAMECSGCRSLVRHAKEISPDCSSLAEPKSRLKKPNPDSDTRSDCSKRNHQAPHTQLRLQQKHPEKDRAKAQLKRLPPFVPVEGQPSTLNAEP